MESAREASAEPSGAAVSPLRVVHVITSLEEGGAQAMLYKLLALRRDRLQGTRVVVLTGRGAASRRIEELGVPVDSLGMSRRRPSATGLPRLLGLLRSHPPDLVQTWLYHADLLGGLAAKFLGLPVIWGIRHDRLLQSDSALTRLTRRLCAALSSRVPHRIICNSEAARRTHADAGYVSDRLIVIPNGFDLSRFRPDVQARREIRQELGIDDAAPVVGLVARFHPHKDHATFFSGAARVRDVLPGARFVLCGEGIDPHNEALQSLVEGARLSDRTFLLGRRADVERVTAALDVACLTSRTESFPNAVGEAMACGVACVATDCGDVREILGTAGSVIPVGDAGALADEVVRHLRKGGRERLLAAEFARERVRSTYSIEVVARRFEEVQRDAVCSR